MNIADNNVVSVKGPKGELSQMVDPDITCKVEDGVVTVERPTEQKRHKSLHILKHARGTVVGCTTVHISNYD